MEPPEVDLLRLAHRIIDRTLERGRRQLGLRRRVRSVTQVPLGAPLAPGHVFRMALAEVALEPFSGVSAEKRISLDAIAVVLLYVAHERVEIAAGLRAISWQAHDVGDLVPAVVVEGARHPDRRVQVQEDEKLRPGTRLQDVAELCVHRREVVVAVPLPHQRILAVRPAVAGDRVGDEDRAERYAHRREARRLLDLRQE